jgi:nucleoid-associated protein YgaU
LSVATFGATVSLAQGQQEPENQQTQSVADAARQERARKQELQKHSAHVYTDDDLKRAHILTPEDRAIVEAKRNECARKNDCSPAPSQKSPASLDANSQTPATSLGEVARRYRKQKELQALKPKQSEPFHLSIGTPALASPILPERPAIHLPVQPELHPKVSSHVFRRDPFSAVPVRPEVRRREIHRPEIRVPESSPAVRENIRPETRPGTREAVRPEAREETVPLARSNIRPNFSDAIRPTLRARRRFAVPPQPKIFSLRAAPRLFIWPIRPPAPSGVVQPAAPVVTVRRLQVHPLFAPDSPRIAGQRTVIVKRGDTLWTLARQNLGRGSHWPELLAANRWIANPNQIVAGMQLHLPTAAANPIEEGAARGSSASFVQVRSGNTLWSLAKSALGRSSDWPCLAAANPSLGNPNRIYEGQHLLLPAACGPEARRTIATVLRTPNTTRTKVP